MKSFVLAFPTLINCLHRIFLSLWILMEIANPHQVFAPTTISLLPKFPNHSSLLCLLCIIIGCWLRLIPVLGLARFWTVTLDVGFMLQIVSFVGKCWGQHSTHSKHVSTSPLMLLMGCFFWWNEATTIKWTHPRSVILALESFPGRTFIKDRLYMYINGFSFTLIEDGSDLILLLVVALELSPPSVSLC